MQFLASIFVAQPRNILVVAVAFLTIYLALRIGGAGNTRRLRPILLVSIAWGLYASWEWLVQVKTPEANIRVDLLVIWPILAIISAWALYRTFRA